MHSNPGQSSESKSALPDNLAVFSTALDEIELSFPGVAQSLRRELTDIEQRGGFTPENVCEYFRRDLNRVSLLAGIPGLLETAIASSRAAILDQHTEAATRKNAVEVISYVVSEMGSHVPLDFRIQLIGEVPDGEELQKVVRSFLSPDNLYFPMPKNSEVERFKGKWQGHLSDIALHDFQRIMEASDDALPRLLAATNSQRDSSEKLAVSDEQLRFLRQISGSGDYTMRSVLPAGRRSIASDEIDALQSGRFARIACPEQEIPSAFRRDIALCSSNLALPPRASCELLQSYHANSGPAHVLALWIAMQPDNAFNPQIMTMAHFSLSTFNKPQHSAAFARMCESLGANPDELARLFRSTADSSDGIEASMKLLHKHFNPAAISQSFSESLRRYQGEKERGARTIVENALAVEPASPYINRISATAAAELDKCSSVHELQETLNKIKTQDNIEDKNFRELAAESLSRLLTRQYDGIAQLIALNQDKFGNVHVPSGMRFPRKEDLAQFVIACGCEEQIKQNTVFKNSFIRLALIMSEPQISFEAAPHPTDFPLLLKLFELGETVKASPAGQKLIGILTAAVLVNGDLKAANELLQYRKQPAAANEKIRGNDEIQAAFESRLASILECEISVSGYGRLKSKGPHSISDYQALGLSIEAEQLRRAVVREFRGIIHQTGVRNSETICNSILSFASRFGITKTVLRNELDRRVNKAGLNPSNYASILVLSQNLGLTDSIADTPEVLRNRKFRDKALTDLKALFQGSSTDLSSARQKIPAEQWEKSSAERRAALLLGPNIETIIKGYSLKDNEIEDAALKAYSDLARQAPIRRSNWAASATAAEVKAETSRISRMQLLKDAFGLPSDATDKIDRETAIQKLPRVSIHTYQVIMSELKFPMMPFSEDEPGLLDSFRMQLSRITASTLSDIDLCAQNGISSVNISDKQQLLAAVGTVAALCLKEILDYENLKTPQEFIEKNLLPRARNSLQLPDSEISRAFQYACMMARQLISNERSVPSNLQNDDLSAVESRLGRFEQYFELRNGSAIEFESAWQELNRLEQ